MAIDFPTGTDFPDNGNQIPDNYEYEGFYWDATAGAWKRKCDDVDLDTIYLKRHGDTVDDATTDLTYEWNKNTTFQTQEGIKIKALNDSVNIEANDGVTISAFGETDISGNANVILTSSAGAERVNRTIADSDIDEQIVNKRFLDEKVNFLQSEIIELEEEIDAIAPSVERGIWKFSATGIAGVDGQFALYDDVYANTGTETSVFKDAKAIWLNEKDTADVPHGFAGVEAGELIELFVQGKDEFGLYEVIGVHDETETGAPFWVIDVSFVRTLEATSAVLDEELVRVKIFNAPSGGAADEFVLKEGDDMTGRLSMDQVTDLEDFTVPSLRTDPSIRFLATKTDGSTSVSSLLYQPGYSTNLVCTSGFWASTLVTSTYIYGYENITATDGRTIRNMKKAGLAFIREDSGDTNKDYSYLAWNSSNKRLIWNAHRVEIPKPVANGVDASGFNIRGSRGINSSTLDVFDDNGEIFRVQHKANETDYISYYGRITEGSSLVNKAYVDSRTNTVDVRAGAPPSAEKGDMWYDTNTSLLNIKISD